MNPNSITRVASSGKVTTNTRKMLNDGKVSTKSRAEMIKTERSTSLIRRPEIRIAKKLYTSNANSKIITVNTCRPLPDNILRIFQIFPLTLACRQARQRQTPFSESHEGQFLVGLQRRDKVSSEILWGEKRGVQLYDN